MFRGSRIGILYTILYRLFSDIVLTKPQASRNSSLEGYFICKGFAPTQFLRTFPLATMIPLGMYGIYS